MMCTNWEQRKAMLEKSGWGYFSLCGYAHFKDGWGSTYSIDELQRMTDSEFLDMLDGMLHG